MQIKSVPLSALTGIDKVTGIEAPAQETVKEAVTVKEAGQPAVTVEKTAEGGVTEARQEEIRSFLEGLSEDDLDFVGTLIELPEDLSEASPLDNAQAELMVKARDMGDAGVALGEAAKAAQGAGNL